MKLSTRSRYGLRALIAVARSHDRWVTGERLAVGEDVSKKYLDEILRTLRRSGFLESHRGRQGGYSLARDPQRITVAAMISVLDGPIAVTECIEDTPGECSQESVCRLRGNWQRINHAVRQALESISLAELTHPQAPLVQLGQLESGETGTSLDH